MYPYTCVYVCVPKFVRSQIHAPTYQDVLTEANANKI